jgi:hypothetical protein
MSSVIDSLRSLATSVAGALPRAGDLAGLSAGEEAEAARLLGGLRARVSDSLSLLAADIERKSARELGTAGLAQRNGFKDGAGFVQDLTGLGRTEAARLIRVGGLLERARAVLPDPPDDPDGEGGADGGAGAAPPERSLNYLRDLPGEWDAPLGAALTFGWLSAAQADALRTGLGTPRPGAADRWRAAVLELIGACWAGRQSPDDLARAATRARACLDTAAAAAEAQKRYELRSFKRFVRTSGMVHYDLELDPESDARFWGPIKQILSPRFGGPRFTAETDITAASELEADPRTNEQLQVDTMIDLIDRAVNGDDGDLFKTHEPQVTIAVTTAELQKARAAQGVVHRHHAGDHSACPGGHAGDSMHDGAQAGSTHGGDTHGGDTSRYTGAAFGLACPGPDTGIAWIDGNDHPITAADALRMICDRGYTPLLFDETGQTIDLGKDQRYFTRPQRRAITKRDGGCLYPGCDRPPEECEYHHINPWARHPSHRKSEVRDGVLLCRRHHKLIHDFDARIERRGNTDYRLHWPGKPPIQLHPKTGLQTQLRSNPLALAPPAPEPRT